MDDLHAAFMPRFLEVARARIAKARTATLEPGRDAVNATLRDLHALAGEAGLLGLTTVLALAREGEERARGLLATRTDDTISALASSLDELAKALDHLDTPPITGGAP